MDEHGSKSLLDRVDWLVSAAIDEVITGEQFAELQGLLVSQEVARRRYLEGLQLHADLTEYFGSSNEPSESSGPPVLGSLGPEGFFGPEGLLGPDGVDPTQPLPHPIDPPIGG